MKMTVPADVFCKKETFYSKIMWKYILVNEDFSSHFQTENSRTFKTHKKGISFPYFVHTFPVFKTAWEPWKTLVSCLNDQLLILIISNWCAPCRILMLRSVCRTRDSFYNKVLAVVIPNEHVHLIYLTVSKKKERKSMLLIKWNRGRHL